MSLTAARPAGGDKPRPYILRVSGDRKYVVGAAFMAARGRPPGSPLRRYVLGRVPCWMYPCRWGLTLGLV